MRKRFLIIVSVLAGIAVVVTVVANPLVATLLRSEQHALLSDRIMLITLKEQDTTAMITFPVNYLREADTVYVGCDSSWWENLQGGAEVRMRIKGSDLVGWAMPILEDRNGSVRGSRNCGLRPTSGRYGWGRFSLKYTFKKIPTKQLFFPIATPQQF